MNSRRDRLGRFASRPIRPTARRNEMGQFAKPPSRRWLTASWIAAVLSLGLLYASAKMVVSDLGSFRSCTANSGGLYLTNCGKQSLNFGDVVLVCLFILSAALTASLMTYAWRLSARMFAKASR